MTCENVVFRQQLADRDLFRRPRHSVKSRMLYAHTNSLKIQTFATIKNWDYNHSAGEKCLLTIIQMIDDKEIGSPG